MSEITRRRTGQFLQTVFKLLSEKPDGMFIRDILLEIPKSLPLTQYERSHDPSTRNSTYFEKNIRSAITELAKVGWLRKHQGWLTMTERGEQAYKRIADPEKFYRRAIWEKSYLVNYLADHVRYWQNQISLFRGAHFPPLSQDLRWRLRLIDKLSIVDESRKKKIAEKRGLFRFYSIRISKTYLISDRLRAIRGALYELSSLAFILLVGILFYRFQGNGNQPSFSFASYLVAFGPLILLLLLVSFIFDIISARVTFRNRLLLMLAVIFWSFFYLTTHQTTYAALAFGIAGIFSILAASIGIDALIFAVTETYLNNRFPEGLVIHNLLLVLSKVDFRDDAQLSREFKMKSPVRLEFAANAIENHLPKQLKIQDGETKLWFRQRCREIAYALREKKKWVLTPKPDTSEYFIQSLTDFVIHFMYNEWDSLERMAVPEIPLKDKFFRQTWTILRALVVGFLPLTVLYWLQERQIIPANTNLIGITIAWAIVNLLWIDPSTKDKMSAMKDLTGLMKSNS